MCVSTVQPHSQPMSLKMQEPMQEKMSTEMGRAQSDRISLIFACRKGLHTQIVSKHISFSFRSHKMCVLDPYLLLNWYSVYPTHKVPSIRRRQSSGRARVHKIKDSGSDNNPAPVRFVSPAFKPALIRCSSSMLPLASVGGW